MGFFGMGMIFGVLWGAVFLWAGIVAFRARRFWATWMMLVGAALQLLGGLFVFAAMFIGMGAWGGGGELSTIIMVLLSALAPAGTLVFAIGLLGLCARFGAVERRAAELEQLTRQLGQRLQE